MNTDEMFLKEIRIHKVANAMETSSSEAPFLGAVESNGTVDTEMYAKEMVADGCTESEESIRRIIQCGDNATKLCVGDQVMKAYTGNGTLVAPHIYGSFDAPDAPVGENNSVEPQVRLGSEIRDAVADITPKEDLSGISDLGGVRILSVLTDNVGFGMIKGTLPFSLAGIGFKPSETSTAAVSLKSQKTGTVTAATVVSIDSTQRIKAKMETALSAGGYKVIVTVTEGSGEEARTYANSKTVTVLAADPVPPPSEPVFTGAKSEGCAAGTVKPNSTVTITGTALGKIKADDILTFYVPTEVGTAPSAATNVVVAADGKSLTCLFGAAPEGMEAGNGRITLEPVSGGGFITTLDVSYVLA